MLSNGANKARKSIYIPPIPGLFKANWKNTALSASLIVIANNSSMKAGEIIGLQSSQIDLKKVFIGLQENGIKYNKKKELQINKHVSKILLEVIPAL